MKKRFLCLCLILATLLAIGAYAATPRTLSIEPDITFNGNKALCELIIVGDKGTDEISATMQLKYGNTVVDSWSDSGYGYLFMEETATVSSGRTYTLVVDVTINDVARPTITISRAN